MMLTFYNWCANYCGVEASKAGELLELSSDNVKLMKLLAEAHLDF